MSYVTHARAALSVEGRLKIARLVIDQGWAQARVAEQFQVSRGTVSKWVARYRAGGRAAMQDRSCRPINSPNRTPLPCWWSWGAIPRLGQRRLA